jgi:arsenate reductase
MAEGILKRALGNSYEVASAGVRPGGSVHSLAVETLSEIQIDISGHHSKHVNDFLEREVETVITVSDVADSLCPKFPGEKNRHNWRFDDPVGSNLEEERAAFRHVREEMRFVLEAYAAGRLDESKR